MLWGNLDYPTGNNKPLFSNTTLSASNSVINGVAAGNNKYYGAVFGVSPTEQGVAATKPQKPTHTGWVSVKVGTGPVTAVTVSNTGGGINANGFITVVDGSTYGLGTGVNLSYVIANTRNVLEPYSTNPAWNGVGSITIVNGGSLYSNASALTYSVKKANTYEPVLSFTLGGRAERIQTETLVAMGSITLDAPSDNAFYSGI